MLKIVQQHIYHVKCVRLQDKHQTHPATSKTHIVLSAGNNESESKYLISALFDSKSLRVGPSMWTSNKKRWGYYSASKV